MGNILRFALQMELDGQIFYLKLANRVKNLRHDQAVVLLNNLAADEKEHYHIINQLLNRNEFRYLKDPELDQMVTVFAKQELPQNIENSSLAVICDLALRFEHNSIKLYQQLAIQAETKQIEMVFRKLVAEEERHQDKIWVLTQLLKRPEEWYPYLDF